MYSVEKQNNYPWSVTTSCKNDSLVVLFKNRCRCRNRAFYCQAKDYEPHKFSLSKFSQLNSKIQDKKTVSHIREDKLIQNPVT